MSYDYKFKHILRGHHEILEDVLERRDTILSSEEMIQFLFSCQYNLVGYYLKRIKFAKEYLIQDISFNCLIDECMRLEGTRGEFSVIETLDSIEKDIIKQLGETKMTFKKEQDAYMVLYNMKEPTGKDNAKEILITEEFLRKVSKEDEQSYFTHRYSILLMLSKGYSKQKIINALNITDELFRYKIKRLKDSSIKFNKYREIFTEHKELFTKDVYRDFVELYCKGYTYQEICKELKISYVYCKKIFTQVVKRIKSHFIYV